MATAPAFTATPKVGIGALTAANTARDGTGALVSVFAAGGAGSRIDKVVVKSIVTTTAGMVRLFIYNGATAFLFTEIPIAPIAVGANTPGFETVVDFLGGLVLPTTYSLRATSHNAEAINVVAFGGDF